MTDVGETKALISYRMEQARAVLEDAKNLASVGGSPLSIINRSYYAMFYASLAVLATLNVGSGKHSGVISLFDLHFMKTNVLPKELGRMLHNAFRLRQESDYSEVKTADMETALAVLADAAEFVTVTSKYLDQLG